MDVSKVRFLAPSLPHLRVNLIRKRRNHNERSKKQTRKFFKQKYPIEEITQSPLICAEAIGYLKALINFFPSEEEWVLPLAACLMLKIISRDF